MGLLSDAQMLTEKQRQELAKMIHHAFLQIRMLGWQNKAEQAAALADAFHNLPEMLWSKCFSFNLFKGDLASYHQQFPSEKGTDFLKMLDSVFQEKNL